MSNLLNLPFSLSFNSQSFKKLLQYRINIQSNSNEDTWSEKAIKGLIKRLTKTSMINDLQTSLDTKNSATSCVTIRRDAQSRLVEPNPSSTVRKAFNDITPVIAFCRIWRWPDLNTHLELQAINTCLYAFQHDKDQICVNPYHYERVVAPFIPPVYVSVIDQAVFNSTTSEHMDFESASSQQHTAVNSPASVPENSEAMTPTPATVQSPTTVNSTSIPTIAVSFVEMPFWCSILYYELNQRIGEIFHASLNSFVIDGFCDPNASDRFCLGSLSNVNRTHESEICRKMLGRGVHLYYIGGAVYAECLSDSPIFVQSSCCNESLQWHPATVCQIPPGCNLKIFNNTQFADIVRNTVPSGYQAVFDLTRMCSIRMSFIKGWGEAYRRRTVMSTPCWVEIHLNGPLRWLDNILQQLPVTDRTSSK